MSFSKIFYGLGESTYFVVILSSNYLLETNSVYLQVPHVHLDACFAINTPEPHLGQDLFFLSILLPAF